MTTAGLTDGRGLVFDREVDVLRQRDRRDISRRVPPVPARLVAVAKPPAVCGTERAGPVLPAPLLEAAGALLLQVGHGKREVLLPAAARSLGPSAADLQEKRTMDASREWRGIWIKDHISRTTYHGESGRYRIPRAAHLSECDLVQIRAEDDEHTGPRARLLLAPWVDPAQ